MSDFNHYQLVKHPRRPRRCETCNALAEEMVVTLTGRCDDAYPGRIMRLYLCQACHAAQVERLAREFASCQLPHQERELRAARACLVREYVFVGSCPRCGEGLTGYFETYEEADSALPDCCRMGTLVNNGCNAEVGRNRDRWIEWVPRERRGTTLFA